MRTAVPGLAPILAGPKLRAQVFGRDLRPGPNEILLAVSEAFGGLGFAARLEPLGPERVSIR